jgi:hypothetical protein
MTRILRTAESVYQWLYGMRYVLALILGSADVAPAVAYLVTAQPTALGQVIAFVAHTWSAFANGIVHFGNMIGAAS